MLFPVARLREAALPATCLAPDRIYLAGAITLFSSESRGSRPSKAAPSYLAPDITQAILDGRQPRDLTPEKLLAHSRLPLAWHDQRIVLGFG